MKASAATTRAHAHWLIRQFAKDTFGLHSTLTPRPSPRNATKCQRFANIPQLPAEPLTAMVSPWPFAQWRLDLIGPMPEGKGQVKYAVVAVGYFTKWAEAEALATITAARIETFVWQNIVCRFGIPNSIITDNGWQFDNAKFKQFCSNLKIRLCFDSPTHPQSNGQDSPKAKMEFQWPSSDDPQRPSSFAIGQGLTRASAQSCDHPPERDLAKHFLPIGTMLIKQAQVPIWDEKSEH
ncbi:hypothetical protein L3X38_041834 [Prunus dulcis]|uniref:Integrase catalytic domain-containing protein n=1 Tax=Prunus dulcis TaxID=3755 RepID=A0AAD4UVG4_PRUDU|nr:hypothetical protein L3X38_041834 [Prunus dulcis]